MRYPFDHWLKAAGDRARDSAREAREREAAKGAASVSEQLRPERSQGIDKSIDPSV